LCLQTSEKGFKETEGSKEFRLRDLKELRWGSWAAEPDSVKSQRLGRWVSWDKDRVFEA
jgi:hypothetical protein